MKVALWPFLAGREIAALLRLRPGVEPTPAENAGQLAAAAPEMQVLIIGGPHFDRSVADVVTL